MRPGWLEYAVGLAEAASVRSEDPHYKVGACVLRNDHTVAGMGYNGAPSGVHIDWSDRDFRRQFVIHAELNALRFTTPSDVEGGVLAVTHHPCAECVKMTAAYRITTIAWRYELDWNVYSWDAIDRVAKICGVAIIRCEP